MRAQGTPSLRQRAIQTAREVLARQPVYLDTETTGLGPQDEIIEITILDSNGETLVDTLVKPLQSIPIGSTRIHGITDADVSTAASWPVIWPAVRSAVFGRLVVIYNQDFDIRMLQQTHARHRLPWKERISAFDLMRLFGQFQGEWDARMRRYRFYSLELAGKLTRLPFPNAHRSKADTLLSRALLEHIANQEPD